MTHESGYTHTYFHLVLSGVLLLTYFGGWCKSHTWFCWEQLYFLTTNTVRDSLHLSALMQCIRPCSAPVWCLFFFYYLDFFYFLLFKLRNKQYSNKPLLKWPSWISLAHVILPEAIQVIPTIKGESQSVLLKTKSTEKLVHSLRCTL